MTVRTFEVVASRAKAMTSHSSMAAASAELPGGVYTTFRTYGGRRVLRLPQHVRRLEESSALLGRPGQLDSQAVCAALREVLDVAGHAESRFRLTFAFPRLFVAVEAFSPLPAALYEQGAACVTVPVHRENPRSKDTRFIATASHAYEHLPPGAEEGLMVAEDGALLEGLSSNFFAVKDEVLHTDEGRVLLGVTRSLVLEAAAAVLPVARTPVRLDELERVRECFITSVSREVLPVVRIDDHRIGGGRPGPKTRAIVAAFASLVEREAEVV